MYQFPLQLLIKNLHHRENIASGLRNIFVHPGREIVSFYVIFIGVFRDVYVLFFEKYVVDMKLPSKNINIKNIFEHFIGEIIQFEFSEI